MTASSSPSSTPPLSTTAQMKLEQEQTLKPLAEFFTFGRLGNETCDDVISRFELVLFRAGNEAGLVISFIGYAWILVPHRLYTSWRGRQVRRYQQQ